MNTERPIAIELYCQHEQLDITFVQALRERGLIQLVVQQEHALIAPEHLARLERLARMHYDLDINLEGIEAISHLLERVEQLQHDLRTMRQQLAVYGTADARAVQAP